MVHYICIHVVIVLLVSKREFTEFAEFIDRFKVEKLDCSACVIFSFICVADEIP